MGGRIFVPVDSTEYVAIKVIGLENGQQIDLSGTPVEVGFRLHVLDEVPGPVTFYTAEWEYANGTFYARILIGPEPGGILLTVDTYDIWVKVYATPQLLIRKSPTLLEIRPAETQ